MHFFLRGEIGVGKSTLTDRIVRKLNDEKPLKIGGFMTFRDQEKNGIFLAKAAVPRDYTDARQLVALGVPSFVLPDAFDKTARNCIIESLPADLLLLDELGFFENESLKFQETVLRLLDGETPVLGVLKRRDVDWYKKILFRGDVTLLDVDIKNRDALVDRVYEQLRLAMAASHP